MDSLLSEKIHFLHTLVNSSVSPVTVINNNLQVTLPPEQVFSAKEKLGLWNIHFENVVDSEMLVHLPSVHPGTIVFFENIHFRQGFERFLDETGRIFKNIAIIIYEGSFLIYEFETGCTYINSKKVMSDFLVENALCYHHVLAVLKINGFADYINTIDKEIILYSGAKGIKRIRVPDFLPVFNPTVPLMPDCNTLKSKMDFAGFQIFFKNELFDFKTAEAISAVQDIVVSLGNIIREADNNLQLYLKNFSFEKLKSDLQREKEKYFSSLRDILGKNLSQIVAFPVSFAASVFAIYRVNDNFILFTILVAFIFYSVFTYYLQALYLKDIKEIESGFKKDFITIAETSGLKENDIDVEKIRIERRISDIRAVIVRFRYLLIILTLLFVTFIFYQVYRPHA